MSGFSLWLRLIPRTQASCDLTMNTHLYAGEHGRIVAVDDNDEARDAVVLCRLPPPLFDGRAMPYLVAKAYIHERGGLWFRHDGLRRMKPGGIPYGPAPEVATDRAAYGLKAS